MATQDSERDKLLKEIKKLEEDKADWQRLIAMDEELAKCRAELAYTTGIRRGGLEEKVRFGERSIQGWKQLVFSIDRKLASLRAALDQLDAAPGSTSLPSTPPSASDQNSTLPPSSVPTTVDQVEERRKKHEAAYHKVMREKATINILPVQFNYVGISRSGKTTFRRRLLGEIVNILKARQSGEGVQPSTGVAEEAGQVLIRTVSCTVSLGMGTVQHRKWSVLKDLLEEANMLSQFFYQIASDTAPSTLGKASASSDATEGTSASKNEVDVNEIFSVIGEALEGDQWDAVKYILEDLILLINTDTGGQAEFLDLQASLVQGPSFNLLFLRLVDDLDREFKAQYVNEEGMSTEEEDSTVTVKEVLFQTLSSIACFSGCFSGGISTPSERARSLSNSESKVMVVGTYCDQVSESEFREKDRLLQQHLTSTEFHRKNIIEFTSEDQLMLAVDNMEGGQDEIDGIRKVLERVIVKNFQKIPIPAVWLMLSLYIRKKGYRTMSLARCEELAAELRISPEELQEALWFLHHHIGVLLYYPEVESLRGTVICEMQVLFDSTTNLIRNTFTFHKVGKAARDKFREKGQFSLEVVKKVLSGHTDNLIPLEKLVELLDHLNILTLLLTPTPDVTIEQNYFMPCVLKSARASKLSVQLKPSDPAPLMLRFECGYVPVGVFPAMITNLVSQQLRDWELISRDIRKNKVQFYIWEDCDTVTLLSHPQYLEIVVSRNERSEAPAAVETVCAHVREVIQSTLHTVTSRMNYHFSMGYQLGFECPSHPGREHLCVLTREGAKNMWCLQDPDAKVPIPLTPHHKVWFAQPTCAVKAAAPSRKSLTLLKWKDERGQQHQLRLADQVSSKWVEFGALLDLPQDRLDGWNTQYSQNPVSCWYQVMQHWLNAGSEAYPATWDGLCELLEDMQCTAVARKLKLAVNNCC